jgi:hypothetical protein
LFKFPRLDESCIPPRFQLGGDEAIFRVNRFISLGRQPCLIPRLLDFQFDSLRC